MADWYDVDMLCVLYLHYILSYVYIFRLLLTYQGDLAIPRSILFLVNLSTNIYHHIAGVEFQNVNWEAIRQVVGWSERGCNKASCILGCDLVFLRWPSFRKIRNLVRKIESKIGVVLTIIRFILCFNNINYIFSAEGSSDLEMGIVYFYLYFVITFFHTECMRSIFNILWLLIQLPLIFVWLVLYFSCLQSCFKGINRNRQEENQGPDPLQEIHIDNIDEARRLQALNLMLGPAQGHPENRVNNDGDIELPDLQNFVNALGRMVEGMHQIERNNSVKMVQLMMDSWKRKFKQEDIAVNPNCCVCLDDFVADEDIIELHCNPGSHGHIFHPDCINSWSEKEKTCPLCRKNFVELIRQEHRNEMLNKDEEEKKQSPARAIGPSYGIYAREENQLRNNGGQSLSSIIEEEPYNPRRYSLSDGRSHSQSFDGSQRRASEGGIPSNRRPRSRGGSDPSIRTHSDIRPVIEENNVHIGENVVIGNNVIFDARQRAASDAGNYESAHSASSARVRSEGN
ncbi:unnamed protein product [Moneuplotes crassus]|uniref:RING-type domain-containing protein n=1 Tax=Euplotes crassus TaxID=5936 RepID=A0AAD1U9D7_EUPCR|nr:unnamed protein product [Moneuplotes crassus]